MSFIYTYAANILSI